MNYLDIIFQLTKKKIVLPPFLFSLRITLIPHTKKCMADFFLDRLTTPRMLIARWKLTRCMYAHAIDWPVLLGCRACR